MTAELLSALTIVDDALEAAEVDLDAVEVVALEVEAVAFEATAETGVTVEPLTRRDMITSKVKL